MGNLEESRSQYLSAKEHVFDGLANIDAAVEASSQALGRRQGDPEGVMTSLQIARIALSMAKESAGTAQFKMGASRENLASAKGFVESCIGDTDNPILRDVPVHMTKVSEIGSTVVERYGAVEEGYETLIGLLDSVIDQYKEVSGAHSAAFEQDGGGKDYLTAYSALPNLIDGTASQL